MAAQGTTDPHQGGDLYDMAKEGTSIPNDAGKMNTIPSVPNPRDEQAGGDLTDTNALREPLGAAATNATDIPRGMRDTGATGEVETGTGDQLPATVETSNLHFSPNNPAAKGHPRADKHGSHNRSDIERFAQEGSGVDLTPSEDHIAKNENLEDGVPEKVVEGRERKEI